MLTAPVSKPQEPSLSDASPSSAPSTAKGGKAGLPKRCWQLGALVAASALTHGLLLAIPLPDTPETEEPEPEEIEIIQEQAMNVARLPQVAVPEAAPSKAAAVRNAEPARPQPQTQAPRNRPQESQPSQRPPRPEDIDQQSDPLSNVEEVPTGGGGDETGDPAGAGGEPTLEEKLADIAYYQWDGLDESARLETGMQLTNTYLTEALTQGFIWKKLDNDKALKLTYSPQECLPNAPHRGSILVQVSADGTDIEVKDVLISTGYEILDEKAKTEVLSGNYTFQSSGQIAYYALDVEVLYEEIGCT
jgi:hypothetical protein